MTFPTILALIFAFIGAIGSSITVLAYFAPPAPVSPPAVVVVIHIGQVIQASDPSHLTFRRR